MYKHEEKWDNVLTRGPPVRALCFGINAYENHSILDNCENVADAIAERVRALSDGGNGKCFAKVCTNLRDKEAMKAAVSKFLNEIPEEYPPRMVLISFSGHAFQDGEDIMMVPSAASGHENPEKLKAEGFSHNELFSILYEEMHRKTKVSSRRIHSLQLNSISFSLLISCIVNCFVVWDLELVLTWQLPIGQGHLLPLPHRRVPRNSRGQTTSRWIFFDARTYLPRPDEQGYSADVLGNVRRHKPRLTRLGCWCW